MDILRTTPTVLLIVATLILLPTTPTRAGYTITEWQSGLWTIFAWAEEDGSFSHCGIDTSLPNGGFSLNVMGMGIFVSMHNEYWNLPSGPLGTAILSIDRRYRKPIMLEADSRNPTVTYAPLGWDEDFILAFRDGTQMTIDFPDGSNWLLSLDGTRATTDILAECLELYSFIMP